MSDQLELPFPQLSELPALLEQIGRGDATDLAIWCTAHDIDRWSWDIASWHSVVDAARPNPILLGVVVSYAAVFWLRSLDGFQRAGGVWPSSRSEQLAPTDDQALWDSCCMAALWWSRCRWPDGIRHLLFLSRDPVWVNALMFRWVLPPTQTPWAPYALRVRDAPLPMDLFAEIPPPALPILGAPLLEPEHQHELVTLRILQPATDTLSRTSCPDFGESFFSVPTIGPPVPPSVAREIRDIMEQACFDRTGLLDRLLTIPSFVAVCLDEPSFLFARVARIGLLRVLESLERAGLSTAPVIAEVAEAALLHGRKDVWEWAIRRPLDDVRQAAFMAYQFNWVLPPTSAAPASARWLVDWAVDTPGLMSPRQWFEWSCRLAQTLLFHSDTMPPSFGDVCAVLLEPSSVDRTYILKALLGPLGMTGPLRPEVRLCHDLALGLVLDAWPAPINTLENSLDHEVWARLDFHPRVQRVLLARCSGLSGQEDDPSEDRGRRRRM